MRQNKNYLAAILEKIGLREKIDEVLKIRNDLAHEFFIDIASAVSPYGMSNVNIDDIIQEKIIILYDYTIILADLDNILTFNEYLFNKEDSIPPPISKSYTEKILIWVFSGLEQELKQIKKSKLELNSIPNE